MGVLFWKYLGPANVELMLNNVPVIAGNWLDMEKKLMTTLALNRWMQIDIVRCC